MSENTTSTNKNKRNNDNDNNNRQLRFCDEPEHIYDDDDSNKNKNNNVQTKTTKKTNFEDSMQSLDLDELQLPQFNNNNKNHNNRPSAASGGGGGGGGLTPSNSGKSMEDYLKEQRTMKTMRFEMSHANNMDGSSSLGGDYYSSIASAQNFQNSNMQYFGVNNNSYTGGATPEAAPRRPVLRQHISTRYMSPSDDSNHLDENKRGSDASLKRRLQAISIVGRRQALLSDSTDWKSFMMEMEHFDEEDEEDDDHSDGQGHTGGHSKEDSHENHHNMSIPFYAVPLQRQRWGDPQVLPHINWGDLFFDLFYVAAAYNLGNMLVSALAKSHNNWSRGLVYFVGIFGPLYNMWETKLVYEARYTVVDYAHRIFEIVRFFFVSFAVLHIKPLDELANPRKSIETFCLTLSMFMESIIQVLLHFELYFLAQGDRTAIQNHTRRRLCNYIPTCIFYLTATLISGILYLKGDEGDDNSYGTDYNNYGSDNGYAYNNSDENHTYDSGGGDNEPDNLFDYAPNKYDDPHFRFLASTTEETKYGYSADDSWSTSDLPLTFCCIAYISNLAWTSVRKSILSDGVNLDIRDHFIPSNIDYMIHRYGEWIMLMIGESVLSLLIVETAETNSYYTVASLGALTVIVLQGLKFESEPSHADSHALWRNIQSGTIFCILIQILSMGLIAFGVSYKIMLTTIHTEYLEEKTSDYGGAGDDKYDGDDDHRLLFEFYHYHRWLAAAPAVTEEAAAALFCGSLTVVLVSLELMVGTHRDARENYKLLFRDEEFIEDEEVEEEEEADDEYLYSVLPVNTQKIKRWKKKIILRFNWPIIIITFVKACLILLVATLNQWQTNPKSLTIAGFLVVCALAISRIIGWGVVHKGETIKKALENIRVSLRSSYHGKVRDEEEEIGGGGTASSPSFSDNVGGFVSGGNGSSIAPIDEDKTDSKDNNAYKEILDASFDAIIVIDKVGLIKQANETTLRDFGYDDVSDLIGKNISILMAAKHAVNHDSYISNFNKQGSNYTIINKERVLTAKRKDGTEYPCIVGVRRIPNSSDIVGFIRDMTSYQQAIHKDSSKSDEKKVV